MTDPVFRCPDHGYATTAECPECDRPADQLLTGRRRKRLSKFVSGALRHFPGDAGVSLDDAGWTPFEDLAAAVTGRYAWATREHLDAVIETDPKGRFERDGDQVRAAYGHSVDVDLDGSDEPIPDVLYHGTAPENLDSIRGEGLRPMGRQAVHLSETRDDALAVGRRHADRPVVLVVDAAGMLAAGHEIAKRGKSTYTTAHVPPAYVETLDESG